MDINDFRINLTFTIEEMNLVFRFLETIPYGQVAGLYETIRSQVDAQLIPPEDFDKPGDQNETDHPL
jgi:hypothetical protein